MTGDGSLSQNHCLKKRDREPSPVIHKKGG